MFKAMILLKRNPDMAYEDFVTWWLKDHSELAAQLPKLKKAVFNLIEGDGSDEYDGVSELWFDNQADFEAAYASEIGKGVAADSLSKVSKRVRFFINEHQIK
jgi:uncharacterized protein (TIGR02118 family)